VSACQSGSIKSLLHVLKEILPDERIKETKDLQNLGYHNTLQDIVHYHMKRFNHSEIIIYKEGFFGVSVTQHILFNRKELGL
jgi:hypothetical protein